MEFSQLLKELREDRNITQRELAKQTGMALNSIASLEAGRRQPGLKAITNLSKFFGVSSEYLRGELDKESFMKKSDEVNDTLEEAIGLFIEVQKQFKIADQDAQIVAANLMKIIFDEIYENIFRNNNFDVNTNSEIEKMTKTYFCLNESGRTEIIKRMEELLELPKY